MPVRVEELYTPKGKRIARIVNSGHIGKEDVEEILTAMGAGGPFEGVPILAVMRADTKFSAEARAAFGSARERSPTARGTPRLAVVIANVIIRVAASFIIRVTRVKTHQVFSSELEALEWLDSEA